MSVKITNHNNPEEVVYIFDVTNIKNNIKERTLEVTDIFGDKVLIDLRVFDVMMTVV